ncbi:MAG: DUF423 domain-containing protein [Gemmatimonadota bacterium]
MARLFFAAGAALALLAVAAGAFGAHALESRLSADRLETWQLASRYQMYHALGLLALAWATTHWDRFSGVFAGGAMIFGVLIFSGSLYALALGAPRWFGAVTPVGGVALLAAWLAALVGVLRA